NSAPGRRTTVRPGLVTTRGVPRRNAAWRLARTQRSEGPRGSGSFSMSVSRLPVSARRRPAAARARTAHPVVQSQQPLPELLRLVDDVAESEVFAISVAQGLAHHPRRLSCRYLYDAAGSALFERITEQPEYYLTSAEA